MATDQEGIITLIVSTRLGAYATALASMEPAIDVVLKIVKRQEEENPENPSIPIMMNLLVAAKDLIEAHKIIERVAEVMMRGGMQHEGPERPQ
jgi:hypothetical protein